LLQPGGGMPMGWCRYRSFKPYAQTGTSILWECSEPDDAIRWRNTFTDLQAQRLVNYKLAGSGSV